MQESNDNQPNAVNTGLSSLDTQSIKYDGRLYTRESKQGEWIDWVVVTELQKENERLKAENSKLKDEVENLGYELKEIGNHL